MKYWLIIGTFIIFFTYTHGEPLQWWQTMSLYQIYPRSFKDSNDDGIGDLKGIESKLEHLVDSKINAFWISPFYPSPMKDFGYDISNFLEIDPLYGTMEDFEHMLHRAHNLSLKVVLDLVPNHSSNEHEWFQKSIKKIEPYTDYYIWNEGKIVNNERQPPNNWVSVFYGSAWTWNDERQAYYYHQFLEEQPDLNYRNELVIEEMKNIMRFWLDKGVDGFRVDAIPHLVESEGLQDEPLSGKNNDPNSYDYLDHIYTNSLKETYDMVRQWSDVLEEYKNKGNERVMMVEAFANTSKTMDYYTYGASFPFNFKFLFIKPNTTAKDLKNMIDDWMDNMPDKATANWVSGNHDQSRLVTRLGEQFAILITAMVQLLPGVAVTYNGDEIGMEDTWLSYEDTQDPQGCRVGRENYEKMSRDPARSPFQWDDTISAGFSNNPDTWIPVNSNYKTLNLAAQKTSDNSYYNIFLKITSLREWPAVKRGALQTKLLNDNVFAFSRTLEGEKSIYVIFNVGETFETVNLEAFKNAPAHVQFYLDTSNYIVESEILNSNDLTVGPRSCSIFVSTD